MKKINYALMFVAGIFLFTLSYNLDQTTNMFFKNTNFPVINLLLGIVTNFAVVVFIMLIIPTIILYKKHKNLVYILWVVFIISFISAFAIKLIVLRQRPIGEFTYPFTSIVDYSFPSMHSMIVFALLPVLLSCIPKQKILWISFTFMVAFSRLYFGFHFLSDVVFGAIFGYIIGHFLLKLQKSLN